MTLLKPISSIRRGIHSLPSDLLTWPAISDVQTIVLFIPGNPGLVDFYIPFLSHLHSLLPRRSTTIHALGHLGHSKLNTCASLSVKSGEVVGLREQVENQIKFIDELKEYYRVGTDGGAKLVLVAHSIGSWISLEVLKARPNLVSQLNFLFPTISNMATTSNGRVLAPLFKPILLPPLALATTFLSYLPTKVITPLVGLLTRQQGEALGVTTGLVSNPAIVLAAVSMGREEMELIKSLKPQEPVLREFGNRIRWYWCKGEEDHWVLDSSVVEIETVLDEAGWKKERRERCGEGMKHAFVLNDDHTTTLARKVSTWIAEDLNIDLSSVNEDDA